MLKFSIEAATLWMFSTFLLTHNGDARIIGSRSRDQIHYPIIERPQTDQHEHREVQQQTMMLSMSQLAQLKMLSYSDDSLPKQIDVFYLGLYETDGDLPSSSLTTVMDGVDAFVYAEMSALYTSDKNEKIKSIQTQVLSQKAAASSRRSLEITMGSNLETQLSITYANEPSPDASDVTSKVNSIFEDTEKLQYLLTNITSRRAADDSALSRVNAIYFLKDTGGLVSPPIAGGTTPTPAPTTSGAAVPGIQDEKGPVDSEQSNSPSWKLLNPIIISATLLLVLVALFVNHRRRTIANSSRSTVQAIDESNKISTVDLLGDDGGAVNLFWESDDIFSIEAALVETSNNSSKSYVPNDYSNMSSSATPTAVNFMDTSSSPDAMAPSVDNNRAKATTDDQSDIFSGVHSGFIENFSTMSSPRYVSDNGIDSLESPMNGGIAGVASSPMNGAGMGDSRSVFSFLSGFASKASTVVASNVTKSQNSTSQQQTSNKLNNRSVAIAPNSNGAINPLSPSEGGRLGGTPHSRVSSLFTFSEEDSEDLVSSSDERSKGSRKQHGLLLGAPSDEEADEDNESLTALATSMVKQNSEKEEVPPTFVNGTSVIVANAEPVRSQSRIQQLEAKIAEMDVPAFNPAVQQRESDCCKETCGDILKAQESNDQQQRAALVDEVLTDLTMGPNESYGNHQDAFTRLSADEITKKQISADEIGNELSVEEIAKELQEAERENKQLKKLSTRWTMSVFSPSTVESPAAATYNGTRVADLASPSSLISNKSEPSTFKNNMIQLQWDDPNQSSLNRAKAAAFAESVAGSTIATGKDSASERYRMLTGRSISKRGGKFMNTVKERMSTKSAGHADGTTLYQIDTAEGEEASVGSGSSMGSPSPRQLIDSSSPANGKPGIETAVSADRARVHAKNTTGDGTKNYQHETMRDWSVGGDNDDPSLTDSDSAEKNNSLSKTMDSMVLGKSSRPVASPSLQQFTERDDTPRSAATNSSAVSGLSMDTPIVTSEVSPSKQLISDLLWLEHKIATTNQALLTSPRNQRIVHEGADADRALGPRDSLSFTSNDGIAVTSPGGHNSSNDNSVLSRSVVGGSKHDESMSVHQSIVCRDCFAPPGKLKIVIHSTKDGPAVHTVKKGSSLEGHIFAGDLIISVDDVDTRSYSAEQVMQMMTSKTRFERKITVLHFEQEQI